MQLHVNKNFAPAIGCAIGCAGKLEQVRKRLENAFSKSGPPGMGAQCCKGDQYMNQVETVAAPKAAKVRHYLDYFEQLQRFFRYISSR